MPAVASFNPSGTSPARIIRPSVPPAVVMLIEILYFDGIAVREASRASTGYRR